MRSAYIETLFYKYLIVAKDPVAAAVLTLAEILRPLDPIIIEPSDDGSLTVKEAASRLNLSSREVYQQCLTGKLRCVRIGGSLRVPLDEIERCQATIVSTALVTRNESKP